MEVRGSRYDVVPHVRASGEYHSSLASHGTQQSRPPPAAAFGSSSSSAVPYQQRQQLPSLRLPAEMMGGFVRTAAAPTHSGSGGGLVMGGAGLPLGWPPLLRNISGSGSVPLPSWPQPAAASLGPAAQRAAAQLPPPVLPSQQTRRRVLQVAARLPGLGEVTVCVDAGSKVQELIMLIEMQVWSIYSIPVEVQKLSDLHRVDLAPSYEVGKLLDDDDRPYVLAHFRRLDTNASLSSQLNPTSSSRHPKTSSSSSSSTTTGGSSSSSQSTSSIPIPIPTSTSSTSSSSSTSPPSVSPSSSLLPRLSVQLSFVEPPPAKILQNKEFCFTVAFSFPSSLSRSEAEAWQGAGAAKMLRVTAACEGGEAVPQQNFTVRIMTMEACKDMVGVFGRLRVNSYYGRKRYLIRVQCADAAWRSNPISSDPVTVLSKKCKHRAKRTKDDAAGDSEADSEQSSTSA